MYATLLAYTEVEDQNPFKCGILVSQFSSVFHVWLYMSLCEKAFSRLKIHNLEVMKIANLHFVSIKIMQSVIKKICPILKSMSNMNLSFS